MSIKYCDWVNGNDSTGDGSNTNPYKTIQIAIDGMTGGDEVRVAKSDDNVILTGTLDFTLGDSIVTGTDTLFSSELAVNDFIKGPDGLWYEVMSIEDDTNLTLGPTYQGSTVSSQVGTKLSYIDIGSLESHEVFQTIDESGASESSKIKVSGGWNLSTQTQTGVTCYRQHSTDWISSGWAIKVETNKQYLIIEKFILASFEAGIMANRAGGDYYLDINYVDTMNSSEAGFILGNYTNVDHCTASFGDTGNGGGHGINLTWGFYEAGSDYVVGTNLHLACGEGATPLLAQNCYYIEFDTCIFNGSPVHIGAQENGFAHAIFRNIYQTGGLGNAAGSGGAGMSYLELDNITGTGPVNAIGTEHDGAIGYLCKLSNINVSAAVYVIGYTEAYLKNITCIYACIDNLFTRIDILSTNNPDGVDPVNSGTGLMINPRTTTIINDYNANDSLIQLTYDATSNDMQISSVAEFRYSPVINIQKMRSNTNPVTNSTFFGSGTIDKNSTGGRTGGPCVSLNPNVVSGVGVTQTFTFVAPANRKRTITYYVRGINGFDGSMTEEVTLDGAVLIAQRTATVTTSYVKHTIIIQANQIPVAGVLVLTFIVRGGQGNVLFDSVTCA